MDNILRGRMLRRFKIQTVKYLFNFLNFSMMKKHYYLIFLFSAFVALSTVKSQNIQLKPSQLLGTWTTSFRTGNNVWDVQKEFSFTLYADFRSYSVDGFIVNNGFWRTEDNLFISKRMDGTSSKLFTTYFDGKEWTYTGLGDNITYRATKISDTPEFIPKKDFSGNDQYLSEPESDIINIDNIFGTWKSLNQKTNETFYFNLYPDQRIYMVGSNAVTGSWTIVGNKFYSYVDYVSEPYITKTTAFSATAWSYESLEDGAKYTATKVSSVPQVLKLQVSKVAPQSKQKPSESSKPATRYSPSSGLGCLICNGTCQENCSICHGDGRIKDRVSRTRYNSSTDRYETEYEDEWRNCTAGCTYGKVQCTACKCKSTDHSTNIYNSTKQVPVDDYMVGKWKASTGEKYTFYNQVTSDGFLLAQDSYVGSWEIEDGLLKMFLHKGFEAKWHQYTFDSFTNTTLVLKSVEDMFSKITLTKM